MTITPLTSCLVSVVQGGHSGLCDRVHSLGSCGTEVAFVPLCGT